MFSLSSLKSLKPYVWPSKNWLLFSLFMALPLALLRTGPIPLVKYLVDEILVHKDASKLYLFPLAIIGLYLLNLGVRFLHYYAIRIAVVATNQRVREALYSHLTSLSTEYFNETKSGVLLSRVAADPALLDNGIASFNVLLREPITFAVLLGYALHTNWKLTLLTFTITPALAFVFGKTGKYVKRKIADYQEKNGESYSAVQEAIAGIRVIHLFNLESTRFAKFKKQMTDISNVLLKISKIEELSGPMIELVTSFAIALILYFGGQSVLSGEMTSGELLAFFAAFAMMINPIRQISDINTKLHTAAAAMERINEFLSWQPKVKSPVNGYKISKLTKGIEFKNVSFSYPGTPDRLVLNKVNFRLPMGKTVALVGQSGSGKSSLVQLLTRMYDLTSGTILVEDHPLTSLDLTHWRNQVAVVSQDVFLFHDTIYENILMGRPNATRDEVIEAARKAHAMEFISRLPDGLNTIVGDRGAKLSGGERQRISIARAFLKDSQCLILDEATSNLDNESEKIVQRALADLMQNRTTLVIAHRLSTIQNADEIIVLKQGVILEQGTYSELMAREGEFKRLSSFTEKN